MKILYKDRVIQIFTQSIQWLDFQKYSVGLDENYLNTAKCGFTGSLCYINHNEFYDQWILASRQILEFKIKPLIAINPAYIHPMVAARMVLSLTNLLNGKVAVNFITGTAEPDLLQIGDNLTKKERYNRLDEFIFIFNNYLQNEKPFSFSGRFYSILNSSLSCKINCLPELFLAGHSDDALIISKKYNCVNARSFLSFEKLSYLYDNNVALGFGMHIGDSAKDARSELIEKLQIDRKADVLFRIKDLNTKSLWKKEQSTELNSAVNHDLVFLDPLKSYANVPFLVGTVPEVSIGVQKILEKGINNFIIPLVDGDSYSLVKKAFELAGCNFYEN